MTQQNGFAIWLTGMSGSGKSSIAKYIAARLRQVDRRVEILDENELSLLLPEQSESPEGRAMVVRRLSYLAELLTRNQIATLIAAISPSKGLREEARRTVVRFVEVFVDCPTEVLIQRDTTGRYKKALSGEIPNFVGITEPYEPPHSPEVLICSDEESIEEGAQKVLKALLDLGVLNAAEMEIIEASRVQMELLERPKKEPLVSRKRPKPQKTPQKRLLLAEPSKPARAAAQKSTAKASTKASKGASKGASKPKPVKPTSKPAHKPAYKPAHKQANKATPKLASKPASKPASKSATKPASKLASKPANKSAKKKPALTKARKKK
ncbi:MAG: adenylyl-sulfate kinase [Cystobacterineae bacterium]|nr:adenylyl-sulfate kinase [Cystobacterineae bacterium]